jgi:hypothetical protein
MVRDSTHRPRQTEELLRKRTPSSSHDAGEGCVAVAHKDEDELEEEKKEETESDEETAVIASAMENDDIVRMSDNTSLDEEIQSTIDELRGTSIKLRNNVGKDKVDTFKPFPSSNASTLSSSCSESTVLATASLSLQSKDKESDVMTGACVSVCLMLPFILYIGNIFPHVIFGAKLRLTSLYHHSSPPHARSICLSLLIVYINIVPFCTIPVILSIARCTYNHINQQR